MIPLREPLSAQPNVAIAKLRKGVELTVVTRSEINHSFGNELVSPAEPGLHFALPPSSTNSALKGNRPLFDRPSELIFNDCETIFSLCNPQLFRSDAT